MPVSSSSRKVPRRPRGRQCRRSPRLPDRPRASPRRCLRARPRTGRGRAPRRRRRGSAFRAGARCRRPGRTCCRRVPARRSKKISSQLGVPAMAEISSSRERAAKRSIFSSPVGDALQLARREVAQPRPTGHFCRRDTAQIAAGYARRLADSPVEPPSMKTRPPSSRLSGRLARWWTISSAPARTLDRRISRLTGMYFVVPGRRARRYGEPRNEARPGAVGQAGKGARQ